MTRVSPEEPADARLRQLLDVEARLQQTVQAARDDAARRVTAAHEERERRLRASRDGPDRADGDRARAEQQAHAEALAAIEAAHLTTLAAISDLSEARIDELARRALARAIDLKGRLR